MRTLSVYRQEGRDGIIWDRAPGEEASQTFDAGAPLVRDASTKELEEWAGGTDASLIVGIAIADASGTAGTKVGYAEANDSLLIEGSLINGTDAYTLLGTEVGSTYSLIKSGTSWYVDVGDDTTDIVCITGLIDAVGDVNPRVICRVVTGRQANAPIPA
jgi:hypothetical protein